MLLHKNLALCSACSAMNKGRQKLKHSDSHIWSSGHVPVYCSIFRRNRAMKALSSRLSLYRVTCPKGAGFPEGSATPHRTTQGREFVATRPSWLLELLRLEQAPSHGALTATECMLVKCLKPEKCNSKENLHSNLARLSNWCKCLVER